MKQYIVDTFTPDIFAGNPAAVCVLDKWLPESVMQLIAQENNLSETAFCVREGEKYRLRWFTPGGEIDLCGHATLAAAFVLMHYYDTQLRQITFTSLSGDLQVSRKADRYEMSFPAYNLTPVPITDAMTAAYGVRPVQAWMGRDLVCVFNREEEVRQMIPDQAKLVELPGLLQHATARGKHYDCVSRSFSPKLAIPEDPVCGSGHCHIVPYWSNIIGETLTAYQASRRGGVLYTRMDGDKVILGGQAVLFAISELMLDGTAYTG